MLVALLTLAALACPDPAQGAATASLTRYTVAGVPTPVRGRRARESAAQALVACGMPDASRALLEWRRQRRAVNVSATVAVLVAWPVGVAMVVHGIRADRERRAFLDALQEGR